MKKLFLASYAAVTLELIRPLLSKPPTESKVAFIPSAGDPYEDKGFVYLEKDKLSEMGFTVVVIDLRTCRGEELIQALAGIDVIFVAGGNTFYLLDQARKSGFDLLVKQLVEKGVLYIGSSAGSILCCPTIEGARRFDDPEEAPGLTDYTGLNLYDKILLPHVHEAKYAERILQTTAEMTAKGYEVVKLTNDEAVVVEGEESRVVRLESL